MIWVFWGLLGSILGGMLFLVILARKGRSKLRPPGPTTSQLLRAAARSFAGVLWTLSHPFGIYGRSSRYFMDDPADSSKDFVREREHELEERQRHSRQE